MKGYWIGLVCAGCLFGNWHDTSTGLDLNKLPHPALTRVRGEPVRAGEKAEFDGIWAAATQEEATLGGKSKSGKPWTVHLCDTCLDEVWRGDLDGNGTVDYVIVGVGPFGNTRTGAQYSLALLLMDREGIPMPFFTPLYHGENGDAMKHFVKLDGQTRLLISRYDEIPSDSSVGPYCSGHWVTQAYGLRDGVVEEVRGVLEGKRFPFVRSWAYTHPECANHPIGFSGPAKILEFGTSAKGVVSGKLRAGSALALEEGLTDCERIQADALVFDSENGREMALPNLRAEGQQILVDKIRAAGVQVELRGVRECSATLVWGRMR